MIPVLIQADRERAARQREYLSQLEECGEYESASEPTSLATTSTMEGEHTIQPDTASNTPEEPLSPEHCRLGLETTPEEEEEEEGEVTPTEEEQQNKVSHS